jgi:hypothetical protein
VKKGGKKPQKAKMRFTEALSKAGAFAVKEAKLGYEKGRVYLDEQKRESDKRRVAQAKKQAGELKLIRHPDVMAVEKQRERIEEIKREVDDPDTDFEQQSKLLRELDNERDQLRQLQEKVTQIKLDEISDADLKTLAVRYNDDGILSGILGSGNRYKFELLRRIKARKQVEYAIKMAEREPIKRGETR